MAASVIVDTGPIVALLDADDQQHAWVRTQFARLRPPLLTCEAVLTESCFLIARGGGDASAVLQLVERNVVSIAHLFDAEAASIARLMRRYNNVPMSLADACLVRLIELTSHATLFTLDSDFEIYRQKGRRLIPLLAP
ncbi:MAG TPA: PIN domain-containing protein [Candidatus Binatia bacterium]|nr:PIN domain-containing protein [Candidatus Binatia bacterium]